MAGTSMDSTVTTDPTEPVVHPTAIVDPSAILGPGVSVGPYSIVEADARIGADTRIDAHVRIARGTTMGVKNRIWHGAVLGTEPQDVTYANELTILELGDRNSIREYATLHRGTARSGKTVVGSDCFIMAYAHVAHDCRVGNHVTLVNSVHLAGHVKIEDWVVIGGVVPVHQFVHIGCHAMVGGGFRVSQDVCPYALTAGYPLHTVGLNVVGLRRRGYTREQVKPLKEAFRILFKSELNTSQAADRVEAEVELTPEVAYLLTFVRNSERGIVK
jgi:UDP-N-acetylglucosamine acyltransferase